jgi:hypothetical protein
MNPSQTYSESHIMTLYQFDSQFAGRPNSKHYDKTKMIHIHLRNRAFVWKKKDEINLLDSILKGYYIPPIICNSRMVDGYERREIMEGGNRATTYRKIMEGKVKDLSEQEKDKVKMHQIHTVVMHGLNSKNTCEMFRRLNKNVKVTDGQLFNMSSEDSNLIQYALCFLDDIAFPFREKIDRHFSDTHEIREKGCDSGQKLLENAMGILSGILYGPEYITTSFDRLEEFVESRNDVDTEKIEYYFEKIFKIFDDVDTYMHQNYLSKTKKKAQMNIGTSMGPIVYDLLACYRDEEQLSMIQNKWVQYLVKKRQNIALSKEAMQIPGAQNITPTKLKRICKQVEVYVNENRLLTAEELSEICHEHSEQHEESDEESDNENVGAEIEDHGETMRSLGLR